MHVESKVDCIIKKKSNKRKTNNSITNKIIKHNQTEKNLNCLVLCSKGSLHFRGQNVGLQDRQHNIHQICITLLNIPVYHLQQAYTY